MNKRIVKSAPNSSNLVHRMSTTTDFGYGDSNGFKYRLIRDNEEGFDGPAKASFIRNLVHNIMHLHHPNYLRDYLPSLTTLHTGDIPDEVEHSPWRNLMDLNQGWSHYTHEDHTEHGRKIYHQLGQILARPLMEHFADWHIPHDIYSEDNPEKLEELRKVIPYITNPVKDQLTSKGKNKEQPQDFMTGLVGNLLSHAHEQFDKHIAHRDRTMPHLEGYAAPQHTAEDFRNWVQEHYQLPKGHEDLEQRFKDALASTHE